MAMITNRLQGHRGTGFDQLHLTIPITTTTATNTTFTATETFERAFSSAPKVIGSNCPKAGGGGVSVTVTATGITASIRSGPVSVFAAEAVPVTVVLEGKVL